MNTQKNVIAAVPTADDGKVQILKRVPKIRYKVTHAWVQETGGSQSGSHILLNEEPTSTFESADSARKTVNGNYAANGRIVSLMNNHTPFYVDELWAQVQAANMAGWYIVMYQEVRISPLHQRR